MSDEIVCETETDSQREQACDCQRLLTVLLIPELWSAVDFTL